MWEFVSALTDNVQILGGVVGIVGGSIGAISGLASFSRRRLKLFVTVTENNDAHSSWHTVAIANRSDLAFTLNGFALSWFISTPLGRLELNRAYQPDTDPSPVVLAPHGVATFAISDDEPGDDGWQGVVPFAKHDTAYLRIYVILPARGGGQWLPVRRSIWHDQSRRERLLSRWYCVNQPTSLDIST